MAELTNGVKEQEGPTSNNLQKFCQTIGEVDANSFLNDGERMQAVTAAYALVSRLETPWDFVLRTCMGQVCLSKAMLRNGKLSQNIACVRGRSEGRKGSRTI